MKLKRWKVEAGMYAHGKIDHFFFKSNAMKWIDNHRQYDILSFTDRWTDKKTYLKDRLYGRTGSPVATIILHQPGGVDIIYNDLIPTAEED
jgi:hypothetical protein